MKTKTQKTMEKTDRTDMTDGANRPAREVADRLLWYEKQLSEVEAENRILREAVNELKTVIEGLKTEADEAEREHDSAICRYVDTILLMKCLINIPDNIGDMLKELLKARSAYWYEVSCNIGWEKENTIPDVLKLGD